MDTRPKLEVQRTVVPGQRSYVNVFFYVFSLFSLGHLIEIKRARKKLKLKEVFALQK